MVRASITGLFDNIQGAVRTTIPQIIDDVVHVLKRIKSDILGVEAWQETAAHLDQQARQRPRGNQAHVKFLVSSGKANFVMSKIPMDSGGLVGLADAGRENEREVHSDLKDDMDRLFAQMGSILSGDEPLTMTAILKVIDIGLDILLGLDEEAALAVCDIVNKALGFIRKILEVEVDTRSP